MNRERRTITFIGSVQGVGFRYSTVQLAADLDIQGTVRNLPDGGVELLVQGAPSEIDALLSRLSEHFGAMIRKVHQDTAPAPPAGAGRGIRVVH